VKPPGFEPGIPVLVYLHSPREKVFGVLVSLQPAGIAVRGIELAAFEDWLRQESRGEKGLGLVTLFYPMNRVERVEKDGDRDYWMIAEEAKAYGMIDELLVRNTK